MGKMSFKSGKTSVTVTDDLEKMIRRTIERSAPTLLPILEAKTKEITDRARSLWPAKTGKSKAGLDHETRVSKDSVSGVVNNSESYSYKIRFAKAISASEEENAENIRDHGKPVPLAPSADLAGKPCWNTLVRDPIRAASKDLAKVCGQDIKNLMAKGK